MSENQPAAAPQEGPLTPVYVVWPGEGYSQVWTFLWIGVAFLMAGLLPWGPGAPLADKPGFYAPHDPHEPMGLARALVVLVGAAMIINCAASVWRRTYTRGASTANVLGGLAVLAELVLARFWEHVGPLLGNAGALMGTPEQKAEFNAIYAERGTGYYLALFGAVVWVAMYLLGILQGSRKLKAKEEAKKAANAAAAAERAAARKASPGAPEAKKA